MERIDKLGLDSQKRNGLWQHVIEAIEAYICKVNQANVAPEIDPTTIRSYLAPMDFNEPMNPSEAVDFVLRGLWDYQVHCSHPRYFGLFNPASTIMGIAADALVAGFNPQVATWNHSPFAVEVEQHLIRGLAGQFGYDPSQADGTFTSGGAEANHTAMLTALVQSFPEFRRLGLRGLDKQPTLYVSTQSHHSFIKAAHTCGLGTDAVRQIPVHGSLQMNVEALSKRIAQDRAEGVAPFLIVATAGTTNAGVVDPIAQIGGVASQERVWFHVDAAWAGAAILVPELRNLFHGIERADSITFDTHKWLSVPMGGGVYLTRHREVLRQTFHISAGYMPPDAAEMNAIDPYMHSIQWSRRFTGLKVFLSLAVAGWDGYRRIIEHQVELGKLLRRELEASGWGIANQTDLPLVCFVDELNPEGKSEQFLEAIQREVVSSGKAWISTTRLQENLPVLRACITNYRTQAGDIHTLVKALNEARDRYSGSGGSVGCS